MIPRKKKNTIIIISLVVFIVMIATTFILLYINTDMFKSNATLFAKYLGQSVDNVNTVYQEIGKSQYNELLKQNKCTTETQVKVNVIEDRGTTAENSQNSINSLQLKIDGQVDSNNQYNYQDVQLLNQDKKVTEVEYIQNENTYGIRFSDLFNQYLLVNNENLKELLKKAGNSQEQIEKMPDTITFGDDLKGIFEFSEEEKQKLKTTYINIITTNVSKDNFSKEKNQAIQIDGNSIYANAYSLTLTKEQMNNLYIKIIEQCKQDEIILNKLDKMQTLWDLLNQNDNPISLREQFIQEMEKIINQITKNNIGQEEAKIIIYENKGTTLKITIQHPDNEINIDTLSLQNEKYTQISYHNTKKEQLLICKSNNEETNISLKNIENEKTTEYSLLIEEKINGNNGIKNVTATYENNTSLVEATIQQEMNSVNQFEEEIVLKEENAINLSELEEEPLQSIVKQVNNGVSQKITEIMSNDIKKEDIWEVLKIMGLVKEGQSFEVIGVTEAEKNRFNSKFEILQGENLESSNILNLIQAIENNFIDMEVISNTELRLKLDRANKNQEVVTTLTSFIEENKNRKYNVKVEYDQTTGLVNGVILSMLEK